MKPAPPEIVLRQSAEVQWAHDLLSMVPERPEVAARIPTMLRLAMAITTRTLCWVLEHDHSNDVENMLQAAEQAMKETGNATEEDKRPV